MIDFLTILVLSLAAYRITRFFLFDTLIDGIRDRWYVFLVNRTKPAIFWRKLLELTSCSWCLGVHVSWALVAIFLQTWPWDFTANQWISVAAIAGIQGMIHALEPGDE